VLSPGVAFDMLFLASEDRPGPGLGRGTRVPHLHPGPARLASPLARCTRSLPPTAIRARVSPQAGGLATSGFTSPSRFIGAGGAAGPVFRWTIVAGCVASAGIMHQYLVGGCQCLALQLPGGNPASRNALESLRAVSLLNMGPATAPLEPEVGLGKGDKHGQFSMPELQGSGIRGGAGRGLELDA